MTSHPDEVALWRFQIIAPLLVLEGRGQLKPALAALAQRLHDHPSRGPLQVSERTIEAWLYRYRRDGLEGLKNERRRDRGQSRVIDDEMAARIEELVRGSELDGPGILKELAARVEKKTLPSLSSLYRFVHARGLTLGQGPTRVDHRPYAFELGGECWQGDVMYGPALPLPSGKRQKTYLIAVFDDATRLVPHAEFYFEQHLRSLKDCLKQAFLKRGLPRRLYFDNGRIFRSRMILGLVARLGIHLIHSRPYQPQGRAKIERFFGTVRRQFLRRLEIGTLLDLTHLNRLFFAWLEGDYHIRPHRGLEGQSPLDAWITRADAIRPLPRDLDLEALFFETTSRRIAKDGTFTLRGATFEAKPAVIGQKVEVRFDPFDLRRVFVVPAHGEAFGAFPVDLRRNRFVQRERPEAAPPQVPLRSLEYEARAFEQKLEGEEGSRGDRR